MLNKAFPLKKRPQGQGRPTGVDGVGLLVGNLDAEFLLDGHDDLDGVKAVQAEVVGEVSGGLDLYCEAC